MKLNEDDIKQLRRVLGSVREYLYCNRLYESIAMLQQAAKQLELWDIGRTLEDYAMQLHYLLDYLSRGQEDPQRKALFNGLLYKTWLAYQSIQFHLAIHNQKGLYYRRLAPWNGYQPAEAISQIIDAINQATAQIEAAIHDVNAAMNEDEVRQQIELRSKRQSDLFYYLLLHLNWNRDDSHIMDKLLREDTIQPMELCIAASAVTLSLLQCYDSRKMTWLFNLLDKSHSNKVKARALIGLLLVTDNLSLIHGELSVFKEIISPIQSRFEQLFQSESFVSLCKKSLLQALRQEQTDIAQKYINEKLMPDLIKHSPLKNILSGKGHTLRIEELQKMDDEEFNPDWKESEKVEKRIKEFSERHQRGEDMQFSAFKQTKRDAFFQDLSHWFFPLDKLQPAIAEKYGYKNLEKNFILSFAQMHCDSDGYSFCIYAKKLVDLLNKESSMSDEENLKEAMNQLPTSSLSEAIRHYLQDLYRYRQLCSQSSALYIPCMDGLIATFGKLWSDLFNTPEILQEAGDLFFEYKKYDQALMYYEQTMAHKSHAVSAHLLQKAGFCYEKEEIFHSAIATYKKADLTKPNDPWTLRHLARCCAAAREFNEAIIYQDQLQELNPNDFKVNLELAQYYQEAKIPDEALNYYHKCNYLKKESADALRGIASSLFALRRFEQSHQYYTQLLHYGATDLDLVKAGHAALMAHLTAESIDLYNQAYRELGKDKFCAEMILDASHLLSEVGADQDEFAMLLNLIVSMNNPSL